MADKEIFSLPIGRDNSAASIKEQIREKQHIHAANQTALLYLVFKI